MKKNGNLSILGVRAKFGSLHKKKTIYKSFPKVKKGLINKKKLSPILWWSVYHQIITKNND